MDSKDTSNLNIGKTAIMAAAGPLGGAVIGSIREIGTSGTIGGIAALGMMAVGRPLLQAANSAKLGPVTYEAGMSRMTKPLNRGVVKSMMEAANGDQHIFADMARRVVKTGNNPISNVIDDFGVDGRFISAFYGMGR